jgi:hypothetical protein
MPVDFEDSNSQPPIGLLGLFQIKSAGVPPRPLNSLQFTFDATDFYLRQTEQVALGLSTNSVTPNATDFTPVGASPALTVPQGQGWLLTGGFATMFNTTAAQFEKTIIGVTAPNNPAGGIYDLLCDPLVSNPTGIAGVGNDAKPVYIRRLLLPPGTKIQVQALQRTGAAISPSVSIGFRFIPVPWS